MTWQKRFRIYQTLGSVIYEVLLKLPLRERLLPILQRSWSRLILAGIPNPLLVQGFYMYWHPGVRVFIADYSTDSYEKDTCLLLESLLLPGMVMVDVGANIGYFSLLASRIVGVKGKIFAFEPQSCNCEVLRKSKRANGYNEILTIIEKLVNDKIGTVNLYFTEPGDAGASLYESSKEQRHSLVADAVTLDAFFENENWPQVDIVKMDVEGAEKAALSGMRQLVERNPFLKLIIEFSPKNQANAGVSTQEFFDILVSLGFSKFQLIENGLQPIKFPYDIQYLSEVGGVNIFCER